MSEYRALTRFQIVTVHDLPAGGVINATGRFVLVDLDRVDRVEELCMVDSGACRIYQHGEFVDVAARVEQILRAMGPRTRTASLPDLEETLHVREGERWRIR